jgi:hypothetical protein
MKAAIMTNEQVKKTTDERPPAGCKYVCRYDVGDGREYVLYRFKDEPVTGLAYQVRTGRWEE